MQFLLVLLHIYFVTFTDKPQSDAPALSPRAIELRAKWDIPIDETDYPVNTQYTDSLYAMGATIHHTSRWFNGATCGMTEETAAAVAQLSFVANVEMTREEYSHLPWSVSRYKRLVEAADEEAALETDAQLALYNLPPLHNEGFEGQGIVIAICDGGFYNADTLSCYRQDSLQLGHFDFTDDEDDFYGYTGTHGNACLSLISGIADNYYGAATQAKYYLMRTEEALTESPKETDNLVAAMEKADSLGVNIISISLGYAKFDNEEWNLPKSALDGKSTRVSLAATIAASKGMLLCIAASNEGDKPWETISVPADADSILAVGAVARDSVIGYFSSHGPSADGRIKPEVCAMGVNTTYIEHNGQIKQKNGTSFATPLLAGMAACLWSALPDENAMQIRERIIRSSDRYNHPDSVLYGYGIPDAWKAYTMKQEEGLENTRSNDTQCTKIMHNGQVLIIRNGCVYTITGNIWARKKAG